jgi:hypothetical protein
VFIGSQVSVKYTQTQLLTLEVVFDCILPTSVINILNGKHLLRSPVSQRGGRGSENWTVRFGFVVVSLGNFCLDNV